MTTQKTETLYYCRTCGRRNFVRKGPHRNTTTNLMCEADMVALKPQSCFTCNWASKRACPPQVTVLTREPWLGCTSWSPAAPPAASLPSLPSVKVPTLKSGDPEEVSATFKELLHGANDARLRVLAFGFYAAHVKYNLLKHSQWQAWVEATCGDKSYRTVRDHMNFTDSCVAKAGHKSLKAVISKWQNLPICHRGEFLALPEAEVPAPAKPLREKLFALLANKTKHQLFQEWKQAEEDASGHARPKVGRLKGHGGATKAQRDAKAAADAKAEKLALELATRDFCHWIKANCVDDKIGTQLSDAALETFNDWCKVGFDYSAKIISARVKARQQPAS